MTDRIELDFETDDGELRTLRAVRPADVSAAIVEVTYLSLPARFLVGRVSMLRLGQTNLDRFVGPEDGSPPERVIRVIGPVATRLPVLAFAQSLRAAVERLSPNSTTEASVPEGGLIRFSRIGDQVQIRGETGESATISAGSLAAAVEEFVSRLKVLMSTEFPDLRAVPGLEIWFEDQA
jgi:hypothetical protein